MVRSPQKKSKKATLDTSQTTLNKWISKNSSCSTTSQTRLKDKPLESSVSSSSCKRKIDKKPLNITTKNVDEGSERKKKEKTKGESSKTLKRYNSASSDELPTFRGKAFSKKVKQTETFKKYGVIVPSIDEIMADQEKLSDYKVQVEEAQVLKEPEFKMPISPQKMKPTEENPLDCKHLSLNDITEYFQDNISFLSDIVKGKKFSDRHRRYYDKKSLLDRLTLKDLSYSTSTIVFTFEQLDHMCSLMQQEFDPEDKKSCYFFKVLIPELCLKIFMNAYDMNKREAVSYLENRPVD